MNVAEREGVPRDPPGEPVDLHCLEDVRQVCGPDRLVPFLGQLLQRDPERALERAIRAERR